MDMTARDLVKELQKTVIGQNAWIETLCTATWMHNLKYKHFLGTGETITQPKLNILCIGKSGTGKTLAIQTLGKFLDLPVVIEDASALRGAGWRGTSVSSIIVHALEAAGEDENKARHSIIVLDEFDKIFCSQVADQSFYPTSNLLTFLGGNIVTHSDNKLNCSLDTSSMLFVCLGAFPGLEKIIQKRLSGDTVIGFGTSGYADISNQDIFKHVTKDDLNEYGIPWEFLGRIPLITCTNELTKSDYTRILTDSHESPIKQYDRLIFDNLGVHVDISKKAAEHIAQQASDSPMGARWLAQTVTESLTPAVYNIGNSIDINRITLDIGADGLYISEQKGVRNVPLPKERPVKNKTDILCEIDIDILSSVPFFCSKDKESIVKYCKDIFNASENVKWRPISHIHPSQLLSASLNILAVAVCLQLSDAENPSPTMYDLFNKVESVSPTIPSNDSDAPPLALIQKEFIEGMLSADTNLHKAQQVAQKLVRQYTHNYVYEAKYSKK